MVYALMVLVVLTGFVGQSFGMDPNSKSRRQSTAVSKTDVKQSAQQARKPSTTPNPGGKQSNTTETRFFLNHICKKSDIGLFTKHLGRHTNRGALDYKRLNDADATKQIYTYAIWFKGIKCFIRNIKQDSNGECKKKIDMLRAFREHFKIVLKDNAHNHLDAYINRSQIIALRTWAGTMLRNDYKEWTKAEDKDEYDTEDKEPKLVEEDEETKFAEEDEVEFYDDDYYLGRKEDYNDNELHHAVNALKAYRKKNKNLKYAIAKQQRCSCCCCFKETETEDSKIDEKDIKAVNREIRIFRAKNDVLEKELGKLKQECFGGKCHKGFWSCIKMCCCPCSSCNQVDQDLDTDYLPKGQNYDNLPDAKRALSVVLKKNKSFKEAVAKQLRCWSCCYKEPQEDVKIPTQLAAVNILIGKLKGSNDTLQDRRTKLKNQDCAGGKGCCFCDAIKLSCSDCCPSCCCKSARVAPEQEVME